MLQIQGLLTDKNSYLHNTTAGAVDTTKTIVKASVAVTRDNCWRRFALATKVIRLLLFFRTRFINTALKNVNNAHGIMP